MSTVKELIRNRILDSTEELIKKKNIKDITMTMIAEATEVSRMTLYRYFQDKYDIELAIYKRDCESLYKQYHSERDFIGMMVNGTKLLEAKKDVYRNLYEDNDHQNSFFEGWLEYSRNSLFPDLEWTEENKELNIS